METVSVVSDIRSFVDVKDFWKMNFSGWFTWKKLSQFLCLLCCIARNFSRKTLDKINVNVKKLLLRQITDFELVLHLKNSKKFKLNLSLFFQRKWWSTLFSMYFGYSLGKTDWSRLIIGLHLDPHFPIYFKYLEKLIRHVRWLNVIWTPWFPVHDFYMVILS